MRNRAPPFAPDPGRRIALKFERHPCMRRAVDHQHLRSAIFQFLKVTGSLEGIVRAHQDYLKS